jgi:type IV pilus assembly protein PilZ
VSIQMARGEGAKQPQKQRADPRVNVNLEVQYRTAQEFTAAYAKNISGGGIFIRTQEPLPLNREVQLRFTLPGIARTFLVPGLVVWTNPYPSRSSFPPGMGIKFMDLDPEAKTIIAEFFKENLAAEAPKRKPFGG